MASHLKKIARIFGPEPKKSEDGRDMWPTRTAYVLASMGGAIGFGNLLRFPSQVYNNNGLQWFIPYLIAIGALAIPILILEVAIGQAHRSGTVVGYNALSHRFRGVGLGIVWVGYLVCVYYVPMLSYVLVYFRSSFRPTSQLPWQDDIDAYYNQVTALGETVPGLVDGDTVVRYKEYLQTGVDGELIGWTFFAWFIVWICVYKGVSVTGRVVYITIGLPIIITIALVGRGVSLENAERGIRYYFAEFHGDKLSGGKIWQDAIGQVFYSTGVGFGYFTAYASYNSQFSNAVQDSVIICCSNASFEMFAAFAAFGVVGFLGMNPHTATEDIGSFALGFLTYPAALVEMPGAPVWSILFFLTLFLLGISSSFAMLDALITTICDSEWGSKYKHVTVATVVSAGSCLLSLMYCTQFGYDLLNAIDAQVNNIALLFGVWCECFVSTVLYRHVDVVGQVGRIGFFVHLGSYLAGMILGNIIAHTTSPPIGAGVGFGVWLIGTIVSVLLARDPDTPAPGFWNKNAILRKIWWMGFYSGNQLRRDLNVSVAQGKNWKIPVFWAPLLRYAAVPGLSIIYAFAYPRFYGADVTPDLAPRSDPLHIFAFICAHMVVILIIVAFIFPNMLESFVPKHRRAEGIRTYAPAVLLGAEDLRVTEGVETAMGYGDSGSDDLTTKEK